MYLEENIGETFWYVNLGNVFLSQSSKAIEIKAKINKWELIQFIGYCTAKETISKNKQTTYGMGEDICKW